ncbi:MAG: tyrosine-type recombinase/integrase [Candidatus Falkowbacteria bacterium]
MNITKNFVDKLKLPLKGMAQKKHFDDTMKGFGVRITSNGVKSFFIEKKHNHRAYRLTLGQYPAITIDTARQLAQEALTKVLAGADPTIVKQPVITPTLQEIFVDLMKARKNLSANTIKYYKRIIANDLSCWSNKPIAAISREMISKKHAELGVASQTSSNLVMRVLRAVFTFAAGNYFDDDGKPLIMDNPVKVLSHTKAWYSESRRSTIITPAQLSAWYKAVMILDKEQSAKSTVIKDYLLLLLFTGLRKQEAATLKWSQVDFNNDTITIYITKNKEQHVIPISSYVKNLLQNRYNAANIRSKNAFVFTGESKKGHITNVQKYISKLSNNSGVAFTLHDLRRTFITIAESLDNISAYTLKRLLNHKSNNDVTGGYIILDIERLRSPMQRIADRILDLVGSDYAGNSILATKTTMLAV